MKVYKIQFEDTGYDCWGKIENYGWEDYDSNLYASEELAEDALKNIERGFSDNFRIKEAEVIDYK